MINTNIRYQKFKIFTVFFILTCNVKGQNIIEYKFPKPVEDKIIKEYSRNFYNKETQYLYITLNFNCDTTIAYMGYLDKNVPDDKITPKFFILNTNRYLVTETFQIPIVFKSDFLFYKNSFVVKNHSSYIKFNSSGEIWEK